MANASPQKSVSPAVTAAVVIAAVIVIFLVGWHFFMKQAAPPSYDEILAEKAISTGGGMKAAPGMKGGAGAK